MVLVQKQEFALIQKQYIVLVQTQDTALVQKQDIVFVQVGVGHQNRNRNQYNQKNISLIHPAAGGRWEGHHLTEQKTQTK